MVSSGRSNIRAFCDGFVTGWSWAFRTFVPGVALSVAIILLAAVLR